MESLPPFVLYEIMTLLPNPLVLRRVNRLFRHYVEQYFADHTAGRWWLFSRVQKRLERPPGMGRRYRFHCGGSDDGYKGYVANLLPARFNPSEISRIYWTIFLHGCPGKRWCLFPRLSGQTSRACKHNVRFIDGLHDSVWRQIDNFRAGNFEDAEFSKAALIFLKEAADRVQADGLVHACALAQQEWKKYQPPFPLPPKKRVYR